MDFLYAGRRKSPKANSAIFVDLKGGAGHTDTFDMKPQASVNYRGAFKPVATKVAGMRICEHLSRLSTCAHLYSIVNGVSHTLADHGLARSLIGSGNPPQGTIVYPGYGAVVSKELGAPKDLPPFVAIPNTTQRAGYLGIEYSSFDTEQMPIRGRRVHLRGLSPPKDMTKAELLRREQLLKQLDLGLDDEAVEDNKLDAFDRFRDQSNSLVMSARLQLAFDLSRESPKSAARFGESSFGAGCLLGLRLVEAGVRFVTVTLNGWDTHQDNFTRLKAGLLPNLDAGLSALLTGLTERGLLESTLVVVTGEFGRTPSINDKAGRDHHPKCMSLLIAGGGSTGGQVVGASDDRGELPKKNPYSPGDLAATIYQALGIDIHKEYQTNTGRPIKLIAQGKPIDALFG